MRLANFYEEVCRRVETEETGIDRAEIKEVLTVAGDLLRRGMAEGWALSTLYEWTRPADTGRRRTVRKRMVKVKRK